MEEGKKNLQTIRERSKKKKPIRIQVQCSLQFQNKIAQLLGKPDGLGNSYSFPVKWHKSINNNGNPSLWCCACDGDGLIVDAIKTTNFSEFKSWKWIFTRSVLPYGALSTNIGPNKEVVLTNFLTYAKHIFNSEESWREAYVGSSFFCQFSLSFRKSLALMVCAGVQRHLIFSYIHIRSSKESELQATIFSFQKYLLIIRNWQWTDRDLKMWVERLDYKKCEFDLEK